MKQADIEVGVEYAFGHGELGSRYLNRVRVIEKPARGKAIAVYPDLPDRRMQLSTISFKGTWADHERQVEAQRDNAARRQAERDAQVRDFRSYLPDDYAGLPYWLRDNHHYWGQATSGNVSLTELLDLVKAAYALGQRDGRA